MSDKRVYCAWPSCNLRLERGRTTYCGRHQETWPVGAALARLVLAVGFIGYVGGAWLALRGFFL